MKYFICIRKLFYDLLFGPISSDLFKTQQILGIQAEWEKD